MLPLSACASTWRFSTTPSPTLGGYSGLQHYRLLKGAVKAVYMHGCAWMRRNQSLLVGVRRRWLCATGKAPQADILDLFTETFTFRGSIKTYLILFWNLGATLSVHAFLPPAHPP